MKIVNSPFPNLALAFLFSSVSLFAQSYLGFDRNTYPGDANLKALHQTFAYTGYWLNNPPGEKRTPGPATAPPSNPPASASSCSSTDASTLS
jgi:hypothetical protein